MLGFDAWQCFGEDVGGHFVSRAINELDVALLDVADKVVSDVDMLGACMVIVVLSKCDCRLVVAIERGRLFQWAKTFADKPA